MPWSAIAASDIQSEITPAESGVIQAVQGNGAVLQVILNTVVQEAQAWILTGGNQIGQPGTVPDQVRGAVIAIARFRWFDSLPQTKALSEPRQGAYEAGMRRFDDIRAGREKTEIPSNPQQVYGPSFHVQTVNRSLRGSARFEGIGST